MGEPGDVVPGNRHDELEDYLSRHSGILVLFLAVVVCSCSLRPQSTATPSSPAAISTPVPTASLPVSTPTGLPVFPPTPTTMPPSTQTPTPTVVSSFTPTVTATAPITTATPPPSRLANLCSADLASRPPVAAQASENGSNVQAAAMIPTARGDLSALTGLTHYTITATIDVQRPAIYGVQTVSYVNREPTPLTELYFGLYPNAPFNGARLDVADVTVNGVLAATSLSESDTALRVGLPALLSPGDSVIVNMSFTTTIPTVPPGGYTSIIYSDDILIAASWYPILLVYDSAGWHSQLGEAYGDLVFSESALYTVHITSPADLVVVTTGIPSQTVRHGDSTRTATFISGPVRDFYLMASHSFCVTSRQVGETIVNSYYLEGSEEAGKRAADVAAAMMDILNRKVGIYPYREFDVAESPTRAGGVEYPQVVTISSRYYSTAASPQDMDFVVAHETAHQWWYGIVGNDQVLEPWLDEALADYSVVLYWEQTYGATAADALIRRTFEAPYEAAVRARRDMPVNLPVAAYGNANTYSAIVYDKGALFYVNLRRTLGDELFFRILREYFARYKYGISRGEDFLNAATSIAGSAARQVYDTWIRGTRP